MRRHGHPVADSRRICKPVYQGLGGAPNACLGLCLRRTMDLRRHRNIHVEFHFVRADAEQQDAEAAVNTGATPVYFPNRSCGLHGTRPTISPKVNPSRVCFACLFAHARHRNLVGKRLLSVRLNAARWSEASLSNRTPQWPPLIKTGLRRDYALVAAVTDFGRDEATCLSAAVARISAATSGSGPASLLRSTGSPHPPSRSTR
jgi:hypothetical protein